MKKILNTIIGVFMIAGATALSVLTGGVAAPIAVSVAIDFARRLLDSSTEFLGDGVQGMIEGAFESCKKNRRITALIKELKKKNLIKDYEKSCKLIYNELKEHFGIELSKKIDSKLNNDRELNKGEQKKVNIANAKMIIALTNEILLNENYDECLCEASEKYRTLKEDEKTKPVADYFLALIEQAIDYYIKIQIQNYGDPTMTFYAAVVVKTLKKYCDIKVDNVADNVAEEVANKLLSRIGGNITLNQVGLSSNPYKYVLNACPGCGYDGPMIYVDDENTMHCAACGGSYHVLQFAEPELWQQCEKEFTDIKETLNKIFEQGVTVKQIQQELKDKVGEQGQILAEWCEAYKNDKAGFEECLKQLDAGIKAAVTQQQLESALSKQSEQTRSDINQAVVDVGEVITQSLKTYTEQINAQLNKNNANIAGQLEHTGGEILDAINQVNLVNATYNEILVGKLDSLGTAISEIYDYVIKSNIEHQQQMGQLYGFVQTLCTKELFESMRHWLMDAHSEEMDKIHTLREENAFTRAELAHIKVRIDNFLAESEWMTAQDQQQFWDGKITALKDDIAVAKDQIRLLQTSSDKNFAFLIESEKVNSQKIDLLLHQVAQIPEIKNMLGEIQELFLSTKKKYNIAVKQMDKNSTTDQEIIYRLINCYNHSDSKAYDLIVDALSKYSTDANDMQNILTAIVTEINKVNGNLPEISNSMVNMSEEIKEMYRKLVELERVLICHDQDNCKSCLVPGSMTYRCNICGSRGDDNVVASFNLTSWEEGQIFKTPCIGLLVVRPNPCAVIDFQYLVSSIANVWRDSIKRILIVDDGCNGEIKIRSGACSIMGKWSGSSLKAAFPNLEYFAIKTPQCNECAFIIEGDNLFVDSASIHYYGMKFISRVGSSALEGLLPRNNLTYEAWMSMLCTKFGFKQVAIQN